ncbi:hypothetical protein [Natrarchaeobius oligotrophus]|nr:hypothetical protein [Natrarchaeobius chitinivorans]
MASTVLESIRGWGRSAEVGPDPPQTPSEPAGKPDSAIDAEALLRSTSAVVGGNDGLRLESTFRTAWHDRMREIRETNSRLTELATRLDGRSDRLALEVTDEGFAATRGRDRVGCWPSDGAFLADLASTAVLEESDPTWETLESRERRIVLTALRLFLEWCPNCDGELVGETTPTDVGGGDGSTVRLECVRCGSLLVSERDR